jgi:hypothetical protein
VAHSDSTASTVETASFLPSAVNIGDIVVFNSGPVVGESQIISAISTNPTTTNTRLTLVNSLSDEPDGASFSVFSRTYGQCELFDPSGGGSFAGATTLPDDRFGHRVTTLQDGRVLLTGGFYPTWYVTSHIDETILIWDPSVGAGGWWYRCGGGSGTFSSSSALLASNRFFHTATLLMDGRVLIAGGVDDATGYFAGGPFGNYYQDQILQTCDVCESAGRSADEIIVYSTGAMKSKRFFHTATLLRDGRVLITGGFDYLTPAGYPDGTNTAEIYDPQTGTFRYTAGPMIEARAGHVATLLPDGRVLISGGRGDFFPEIYDPATDSFYATGGTMTGHHYYGTKAVTLHDGRVLVTGGQRPNYLNRNGNQFTAGPVSDFVEILETDTSLFKPVNGTMTDPRIRHTMTILDDGRVLIAGGDVDNIPAQPSATTDIFDPTNDTLTTGPNISARYGHTATKLNGFRTWSTGTVVFDGSTTVQGTGTNWVGNVVAGDRIRLTADSNGAYFEITNIAAGTPELITILPGAGFNFPIPTGTGAYTIRIERPYSAGTATFTYNSTIVTGTGTTWLQALAPGMVIRPVTTTTYHVIASVDSDIQVTLSRVFPERTSSAPEAYTAKGNSQVLILGGGQWGQPLITGEIYDPITDSVGGCANTLALGRFDHTTTVLPNGWVLILGGNNNFDRTAELFDPATLRFKFITNAMAYAPRNNHTAQLMTGGNVFIAGGEVAQAEAEVFFPDVNNTPATDDDGDGFVGLDLAANSFQPINPSTMNGGRVAHTMTYIPGTPDRILLVGGSGTPGTTTGEILTWVAGAPLTSTFGGSINLARSPMQAHADALMIVNENVVIMRGHTVQIFFSK